MAKGEIDDRSRPPKIAILNNGAQDEYDKNAVTIRVYPSETTDLF